MIEKIAMKQMTVILLLCAILQAQEVSMTKSAEGGLVHNKQKGRYDIVLRLPQEANSFDTLFDYAKPFATFRLANVTERREVVAKPGVERPSNATAFGGVFGFDTASLYGMHLHLGAYVSQKIHALNPDNPSNQSNALLNATASSYTYVGEASIAYENSVIQIKAGRIRVDTPYADSDDIRMSPNSFEGASTYVNISQKWKVEAFFLTRWAGVDADEVDIFTPLVHDGYGLFGGGITYMLNAENEFSLWVYNIDKESDIVYAEGAGDLFFSEAFHLEWGLQGSYIHERSDSAIAGEVVGAMMIADFDLVYVGLAYNYVFEENFKSITDGFGGGPYYTSLDEQTIGAISALSPGHDLGVYRLALGVDFTQIGVSGLNVEFVHGHFNVGDSPLNAVENDAVITYNMTDRWYVESIYAHGNVRDIDNNIADPESTRNFQRLVTRLDYSF